MLLNIIIWEYLSKVFKIWLEIGEAAAVKEINLKPFPDGKASKVEEQVGSEIKILQSIEHENVIKYLVDI